MNNKAKLLKEERANANISVERDEQIQEVGNKRQSK